MTTAGPRLGAEVLDDLDRRLAPVDAELAARYPGAPGTRQPVHTVYVPADRMTPDVPATWGALATLEEHAPGAAPLAGATGHDPALVGRVPPDGLAKLEREPVEDLRIDFEDGYGPRPPEASLSIMVGGDAEDFRAARPVLESLGRTIVHVGAVGAGQTVKAANQLIVAGVAQMPVWLRSLGRGGLDHGAILTLLEDLAGRGGVRSPAGAP